MRTAFGLAAIVLICLGLNSCSGNKPEKAFMGTWEGTHGGKTGKVSFMEKGVFIERYSGQTRSGTWTVDAEGNAVIVIEDVKVIATPMKDGRLIARPKNGSDAMMLERSNSKKK